jgi:SAM-dependent methyltransferase
MLGELHAPLGPILRHALALAALPRAGVVLDLACGPGLKLPLLAEACGPGVRLLGVDIDRSAIRVATTDQEGQATEIALQSGMALSPPRLASLSRQPPAEGVVGDALALPLRDGCCAAALCVAALGLFADRLSALRELRRVLRPGATAVLAVGAQLWARAIRWPPEVGVRLATVYAQELADGSGPLAASPDLDGDLAGLLAEAGFVAPLVRAFWLDQNADRSQPGWPSAANPLVAELPLLPWPALRPLLASRLNASELALCDQLAGGAEVELCTLALVALARAP